MVNFLNDPDIKKVSGFFLFKNKNYMNNLYADRISFIEQAVQDHWIVNFKLNRRCITQKLNIVEKGLIEVLIKRRMIF